MAGLFTKIIAGQIPSYKIYEDEWTYAFLTKDAIQMGHTLVIPKVEVDYFVEVPEPYYAKVFANARFIAKAIHKVTGCKRVGTIIAGWDVPHFHYHIVPMFGVEDLDFKNGRERTHEENLRMQADLQSEIARQLRGF